MTSAGELRSCSSRCPARLSAAGRGAPLSMSAARDEACQIIVCTSLRGRGARCRGDGEWEEPRYCVVIQVHCLEMQCHGTFEPLLEAQCDLGFCGSVSMDASQTLRPSASPPRRCCPVYHLSSPRPGPPGRWGVRTVVKSFAVRPVLGCCCPQSAAERQCSHPSGPAPRPRSPQQHPGNQAPHCTARVRCEGRQQYRHAVMQHHDVEKVFGATAAVHRQGAAQPFTLRRYSWHVTAAIAVLCTWLAWASGGRWQRLAGSEIGLQTSQRARAEPPDNATFAICTIINLVADDPQWIDGRAEDLHEVRLCCEATIAGVCHQLV